MIRVALPQAATAVGFNATCCLVQVVVYTNGLTAVMCWVGIEWQLGRLHHCIGAAVLNAEKIGWAGLVQQGDVQYLELYLQHTSST